MKYSLYLVLFIYLLSFFNNKVWEKEIIGGGDAWGYYVYLPAILINGDIDNLEISYKNRIKIGGSSWIANKEFVTEAYKANNGNKVIKYTIGVALLEMPLFVVAHIIAGLCGYEQDGCSFPYMFIVNLGLLLYSFIGLYYLQKWLRLYYDDNTVGWLIVMVGLATNLYFFALTAMSHALLFSLYSFLLYCTDLFYKKYSYKYAAGIGFALGFIILIRPVELLCILIPLLYNLHEDKSVKNGNNSPLNGNLNNLNGNLSNLNRLQVFYIHYKSLLLAACICISIGSSQLIYWKYISGSWLFYSYGEEKFDFKHPHIWEGLFSFQNGWFIYTPMMFLALLGILGYKNKLLKANYSWIILFITAHIYITYSWWCWQYINGLGSRPMVNIYSVMLIPFASLWVYLYRKVFVFALSIGLFLIGLNLFQTYKHWNGYLLAEANTAQFYKQTFFKLKFNYYDLVAFDVDYPQPAAETVKNITQLADLNLLEKKIASTQFSENLLVNTALFNQIKADSWLKISCKARKNYKGADIYRMASLVVEIREEGKDKPILWKGLRIDNKIGVAADKNIFVADKLANDELFSFWGGKNNEWGWVYFYYQTNFVMNDKMILKTYIWNNSPFEIEIDSLRLEIAK